MSLQETMRALEKAGSAQTRKTYARHGAPEPMFGVSFATLKTIYKRIKVDQELAEALWRTGNFDARNLAFKIADPASISSRELDRWAASPTARMCVGYVGYLAAESPHGRAKADKWLAASDDATRSAGWNLVGALAMIHESLADSWFAQRLAQIEKTIHSAPNAHRYLMNNALIAIGCRNASLRKSAVAAAKRIGKVDVDHGDTDCKTPDAVEYIEKCWARAKSKGFESPAAQERSRESMRTRC
ncbi:MAG: DNA alkylation repair protein [Phycisphaerae bacterium]|nr:DNA alkylation repair protein [Phycisphaerae bacterium]NUQ48041.1 DNA alkylation repair protein [Phycisphaerae bacterium]